MSETYGPDRYKDGSLVEHVRPDAELVARVMAICQMAANAAIEAHTAALAEAGYKIVRREPTEAMLEAGEGLGDEYHYSGPSHTWPAMWDAAK